ncbi:hypothetical protein [Nitrosopumilus sp. S6]
MTLFPMIFADVGENSVVLSSYEIKKPQHMTGTVPLTVTGYIQDYERGDTINLFITAPSGEIKEYHSSGTKDGHYFITIYIDAQFELGEHQLVSTYKNESSSIVSFNIIE